jgi:pyruvate dehydrogenase E2 component (dihydrolipoamide acetyltransferase)
MPIEVKLPELGENIAKGDVVRVLVNVGDVLQKDQSILELETDKATIEVPTNAAGKVTEVRVKAGESVSVGQAIVVLDESAGAGNGAPARGAEPKTADPKAADSKTAQPKAAAKPEADVASGRPTAEPEAGPERAPARPAAQKSASVVDIQSARPLPPPPRVDGGAPVPAAPSVRRYARELGVNIAEVSGSGPGGRIGQQDVKHRVQTLLAGGATGRPAAPPLPDFSRWGEVDVTPMSNIRRKTAEQLSASWIAPHVTQHEKADVTALEAFRKDYGRRVEAAGGKLTITAILVKICALAIQRFPQFASSVDMANQTVIVKKYCHIGLAVDTPNGLLVPVIRDADRKSLTEIAAEMGALSKKARDKKLSLDEMAGGVFTITNLGGLGGTAFTPIVNQPEVAILGVSRGAMEPVWRDDEFVPRQMLPLSLSYDHRVIDGADGIRFLRFVAEALEQPLTVYL